MKSKAGVFSILECDIENEVIAFVRIYSPGIRMRVGWEKWMELEKRREVHMSALYHWHFCCVLHSVPSGERAL